MPATTPKIDGGILGQHLGRAPTTPEQMQRALPMRNFLDLGKTAAPATLNLSERAAASLTSTMGNDEQANGVAAAIARMVGIDTANGFTKKERVATSADVSAFHTAAGGTPEKGVSIPHALTRATAKGIVIGGRNYQLAGFARIDSADRTVMDTAAATFGGLLLGIDVPREWYDSAHDDAVWDVTESPIVGGQAAVLVGYTADYATLAVWGKQVTITRAALHSPKWVKECYALLMPTWANDAGLEGKGVNVKALQAALAASKTNQSVVIPLDPNATSEEQSEEQPEKNEAADGSGTLTLGGKTYNVNLVLAIADAAAPVPPISLWWLLCQLSNVTNAALKHAWQEVAEELGELLDGMGITVGDPQIEGIIHRLRAGSHHGKPDTVAAAIAGAVGKTDGAEPDGKKE